MTQRDTQSIREHYGRLVSYCLPCDGVSLAHFLHHAQGEPRCYWASPEVTFAGRGNAIELVAWGEHRFERIQEQVHELFANAVLYNIEEPLAKPRIFGGFAFTDDYVPDNTWTAFGAAHFVLPHYQLVSINGKQWLTINTNLPLDENPQSVRDELASALGDYIAYLRELEATPLDLTQATLLTQNYPMSPEQWATMLQASQQTPNLQKVVLARMAEASFAEAVNLDSALAYLDAHYTQSYRFLFEPRPHHAFYGATPELLAQVNGLKLETMALAGSIRRGATPPEDLELAKQILDNPKERTEHQLVIDKIEEHLRPLTQELVIGKTVVKPLPNIMHLHTPIRATLRDNQGILPTLRVLHPTPAMGGAPRDLAMQFIRENEPFPRGWYAAPVGWIDDEMNGQFAVAIRSAVAQGKRVWMYAGAGIMPTSIPEKEWQETNLKFKPMMQALGVGEYV
jgi:menaquinone-specific isochorismate synthase